MIIVKNTSNSGDQLELEGCSFDDKDKYAQDNLNLSNVGSSLFLVDAGEYYALNTLSDQRTLHWYLL